MHDSSNDNDPCNDNFLMNAFAQTGETPNNFVSSLYAISMLYVYLLCLLAEVLPL